MLIHSELIIDALSTAVSDYGWIQELGISIKYHNGRLKSDNNNPNKLYFSHDKDLLIIDTVPCINTNIYLFK